MTQQTLPHSIRHHSTRTDLLVFVLIAVGLTFVFWRPLWFGGGFVGGDVYSYYLPQKAFFAERLRAGEFPLWNNRGGHGYPLVGESQTGAFYPLHLLFYRTLDLNTAYNVNHLLHYVLAFVFAALFAQKIGLTRTAALLAALVYTYGWFPTRTCWEWAIIGGTYLPLALWCAESFLQSRQWRFALLLGPVLALQMLAGHYNLAFITQLVLVAYIPLRLWVFSCQGGPGAETGRRGRSLAILAAALCFGFALAAVQLLPSWELRQNSRRAATEKAVDPRDTFDPGVGHIPPLYWSQIVASWFWYAPEIDLDRALGNLKLLSIAAPTNKVEAHLYFGMVPLVLVLWGFLAPRFGQSGFVGWDKRSAGPPSTGAPARRAGPSSTTVGRRSLRELVPPDVGLWLLLGLAALLYTSGWLVPITRHLPGFGFFRGPGRYGIVTTLAAALIAGTAFDAILNRRGGLRRTACVTVVFLLTIGDLWLVSRLVTYSPMVARPPIDSLAESEVRRILLEADGTRSGPATLGESPVRLFAPGANLPNLLGVAATPVYLGIGPAAYFDRDLKMPETDDPAGAQQPASPAQIDWLQRAGVTHILSFGPLSEGDWPVRLVWQGPDAFLNPAWGRAPAEPVFLYELEGSRGRVAFVQEGAAKPQADNAARITELRANRIVIEAKSPTGGRLLLTDLMYPGWKVTIDGQLADAILLERMYRAVNVPPGNHTVVWSYRPKSLIWGGVISVAAAIGLLIVIALPSRSQPP